MSSTRPSAKYSCSGSPDKLLNGRTAIDGISPGACGAVAGLCPGAPSLSQRQTRTGVSIFFSVSSPTSVKVTLTLPATGSVVVHVVDADGRPVSEEASVGWWWLPADVAQEQPNAAYERVSSHYSAETQVRSIGALYASLLDEYRSADAVGATPGGWPVHV